MGNHDNKSSLMLQFGYALGRLDAYIDAKELREELSDHGVTDDEINDLRLAIGTLLHVSANGEDKRRDIKSDAEICEGP